MAKNQELTTLEAAKAAAATLKTTASDLAERHQARTQERNRTANALRSLDECLGEVDPLVNHEVKRWEDAYAQSLAHELSGPTDEAGSGSSYRLVKRPPRLPEFGDASAELNFRTLCALAPDLMKGRLREIVTRSKAVFGLPAAERTARLATLDAEIAVLEQQHTELVDSAAQYGIALAHLPAVAERREEERRERERQAELERQRALIAKQTGQPLDQVVVPGAYRG